MRNLLRFVLCFVTFLSISYTYNVEDFDPPGIFSRTICDDEVLKAKLVPLCHCRERVKITDINSLCRSHEEFGNCIGSEIHEDKHVDNYMSHVFSNKRFKQVMTHLCSKKSDAAKITACTMPEIPLRCNTAFNQAIKQLNNTSEERMACSFTERTSECYWRIYEKECPPTVRYFWSTLSESYMDMKCSKYGSKSKGDKCDDIKNAFHPNPKKHTREQCHEAVHTMRQCFELEKLSSMHHGDVWMNMEFELDRYIRFQRFRCDIKKEKDENYACEYPLREDIEHCLNAYLAGFENQSEQLRLGKKVTVPEICSLYDNATQCVARVLRHCPVSAIHLHSLFCGSMPTSCHCPVNLEAEIMARSSRSSRQTTSSAWTLILCLTILLLYRLTQDMHLRI